ncbi:unnamed protein product [Owenia fusiformis]|nr:unnamed protein product [Owenia fusiformis]
MGLRKYIAEPSKTSVFAFLHIASHGMAAAGCAKGFGIGGESDCLNQVDTEMCIKAIEDNRDLVVGVKVRLTANVANDGANEEEIYRRAKEAAQRTGTPLMIHHTFSTIPIQKQDGKMCCPGDMSPGDIYTHSFHASPSSIIDAATKQVYPEVVQAQNDGVLFDLGHGQGSFSWTVAEICAKSGFWPNIVSTDLHSGNINGPSYDLPSVMTKMLHIGMPLEEVIKATTQTPAAILNNPRLNRQFGSLSPGRDADVTLLKLEAVDYELEDCEGEMRSIKQQLVPVKMWKCGDEHTIQVHDKFQTS